MNNSYDRQVLEAKLGLGVQHPLAARIGQLGGISIDAAIDLVDGYDNTDLLAIAGDDRLPKSIRKAAEIVWFSSNEREQQAHVEILRDPIWAGLTNKCGWFGEIVARLDGTVGMNLVTWYDEHVPAVMTNAIAGKTFRTQGCDVTASQIGFLARHDARPTEGWLASIDDMPTKSRLAAVLAGVSQGETVDETTARRFLRRAGQRQVVKALTVTPTALRAIDVIVDGGGLTPEAAAALADAKSPLVRLIAFIGGANIDREVIDAAVRDTLGDYRSGEDWTAISHLLWRAASPELVDELLDHRATGSAAHAGLDIVEFGDRLGDALRGAYGQPMHRWRQSGINRLDRDRIASLYNRADVGSGFDWAVAAAIDQADVSWMLKIRPKTAVLLVDRFEQDVRDAVADGLLDRI